MMKPPSATKHRKTRVAWNEPGHAHELTFSCFQRLPLLNKDRTRKWLIEALGRTRKRYQLELWAYVIMPEHAHVLVWPRQADYSISAILKSVKQPVARAAIRYLRQNAPSWLRRLEVARAGKIEYRFWQEGGGYDRNVFDEHVAWTCVEYMHANPVRRGLVEHPTDWPWSSARWYAGMDDVLLEMDAGPDWPSLARRGRGRRRE
jgi:putative transposase